MNRPKLLGLGSGAGGFDFGFFQAGFDVTGSDIIDHPAYPFELIVEDMMTIDLAGYDAYVATPPCQGYHGLGHNDGRWPRLIAPIRERLMETGKPFVIENIPDAWEHMKNPTMLCGSSFGLSLRRHRYMESNITIPEPGCDHDWQVAHKPYRIYANKSRTGGLGYRMSGVQPVHGGNHNVGGNSLFFKSVAMGIDWMNEEDLNDAVPPAYGRYVGKYLLEAVNNRR